MSADIKLVICVFAHYQTPAYILEVWTQYIDYELIQAFMLNQPKKKKKTWTQETSLVHEQAAGQTW